MFHKGKYVADFKKLKFLMILCKVIYSAVPSDWLLYDGSIGR